MRGARVDLVWWASQFAVEVAPDWRGHVERLGVGSSRVLSSASWACGLAARSRVAAVSVASIDHNGDPGHVGQLVAHAGDRAGHPMRVVRRSRSWTNPSSDHRQSDRARKPLSTREIGGIPGSSRRLLTVVSTGSTSGGPASASRAGPHHAAAASDVRQPDSQPATLGCRVAATSSGSADGYQVPGDGGSGWASSWMTYAVPPEPPSQAASSWRAVVGAADAGRGGRGRVVDDHVAGRR